MAPELTRLTHKIAIQLHLVAESCTIYSSRSRRPVRKLLDTPSYIRSQGRFTRILHIEITISCIYAMAYIHIHSYICLILPLLSLLFCTVLVNYEVVYISCIVFEIEQDSSYWRTAPRKNCAEKREQTFMPRADPSV
jgi:hypothetical protein